jgi:Cu/Ag efflux protein CusF
MMDHSAMGHAAPAAAAKGAAAMADGEVKKIDTTAQTITLAHGPIMNLGMPAMTMATALLALDESLAPDRLYKA